MKYKIVLLLLLMKGMPVAAQNWDMNRVPPEMQRFMATCYAVYQRVEDKGRLYRNTDILKKLGIHDQIISHPAYEAGKELPLKQLSRDDKDACRMAIYGMIGKAEMVYTGKQAKYPTPNKHYCLGYVKTVLDRGDVEQAYCKESVCRDKSIVGCVDKCVKKVHEFKSFKTGTMDGKMMDYKQLVSCSSVMTQEK